MAKNAVLFILDGPMIALLAFASALPLALAGKPPAVCDFRLALESDAQWSYTEGTDLYTQAPDHYKKLGLTTSSATVINDGNVAAGKPVCTCSAGPSVSCHQCPSTATKSYSCDGTYGPKECCVATKEDFLNTPVETIEKCWSKFMTSGAGSKLAGGNETTNVIVVDIEACEGACHPRHFWNYTDAELKPLVAAFVRRMSVVRKWLPKATLGLYGTCVHDTNGINVTGYQRAAQFGLFDDIDILVPVMYLGTATPAYTNAIERLSNSSLVKRRDNSTMPMWPNLRFAYFGGRGSDWPVSADKAYDQIKAIEEWDGGPGNTSIGGVLYWNGHDNDTMASWFGSVDPVGHAGC